jgi:hypothetical protein
LSSSCIAKRGGRGKRYVERLVAEVFKGVDTVCWEDLSLRKKPGKGLKVEGDGR